MSLRDPPLPEWPGKGYCRWCADPILHPAGHRHAGEHRLGKQHHTGVGGEPNCIRLYWIATNSKYQREACLERDGGRCASCGKDASGVAGWRQGVQGFEQSGSLLVPYTKIIPIAGWQADHVFPLWLVDRDRPREEIISFWMIGNLQTLCLDCHSEKSAREAAQRGKISRIQKKSRLHRNRLSVKTDGRTNIGGNLPWEIKTT